MIDLTSFRNEYRYELTTTSDQIIFNTHYIDGYTFYLQQPKESLKSDYGIPQRFKEDFVDFKNYVFDRSHMLLTTDLNKTYLQNSETCLLTNKSP